MADMTVRHPMVSSHEAVAVAATAIGLTASKYNPGESTTNLSKRNAEAALITVEDDQVRWTCDGTTPTSTVGHRLNVDDVLRLEGFDAISKFRAIRITGTASLKVSYFGG